MVGDHSDLRTLRVFDDCLKIQASPRRLTIMDLYSFRRRPSKQIALFI